MLSLSVWQRRYLLTMALFSPAAFAADVLKPSINLYLGPYYSTYDNQKSDFSQDKGSIHGITARLKSYNSFAFSMFELSYGNGSVEYNGDGLVKGIPAYTVDGLALIGQSRRLGDKYVMSPYVGVGYRKFKRDANGFSSNVSSNTYYQDFTYVYTPLGVELKEEPSLNGWTFGGRIEYGRIFHGLHNVRDNTSGTAAPYITNVSGGRFYVSMDLSRQLLESGAAVVIEPYYVHWNLEQTETSTGSTSNVQTNSTDEWGVAFLFSF